MRQVGRSSPMRSSNGFTAIEMVVVLAIIMVLAAIALPQYMQWRQNTAYRETARQVMSELRQARSQAIATDAAQCVQFDKVNQQYGFNTTCAAISNWTKIDLGSQATVSPIPASTIQFTPTGIASSGTSTIFVLDLTGNKRFYIQVNPTGRIFVQGPLM
jgi:prepilin-type N-terminal cleavage/methylation domain-containing protein